MPKRQTIGERVRAARLEAGIDSIPQLTQRILDTCGQTVGQSTVRDIESDSTPNPGIKTLEHVARGVGLDPLELISLGLDDPPELDRGYSETQFAQLARTYKKVNKEKRPFADMLVRMVIEQIDRLR